MADIKQIAKDARFWPSLTEVAEDYGLSKYAVRQALERREIEAIKIGTIRVNPESVERWLESRYCPGRG